jgi:hypothetical protein
MPGVGGQGDAVRAARAAGLTCRRCGFDLRGLPEDGVCPECAMPIARSRGIPRLSDASPEYLLWARRGAALAFVAGVGIFVELGAMIGMDVLRALNVSIPRSYDLLYAIVVGGLWGANLLGWWWLTAPDPAEEGGRRRFDVRFWVRATLVAMTVFAAYDLVVALTALRPPRAVVLAAEWGSVVFGAITYFPGMLFMRNLARRVPDERLARMCGTMLWLGPLLLTVGILLLLLGPLAALGIMAWIQWRAWRNLAAAERVARAEEAAGRATRWRPSSRR